MNLKFKYYHCVNSCTGEKLPELNISVLLSIILEQEKCRFFDDLYGKQIIDAFDKGGLISEDIMVLFRSLNFGT